ncbi:3-deoxy-manno-octulosonate cytidylyltransferase [Blochmannia endosymbiont of Camponotus sp.]|uniref:3-deoxy-manno-octulosonate cytidylyltransferase n=1 Tax=Blochmannia endosymbiont of Camponotus sp. TaxID=700220 RepID=UPI0020244BB0|nr:3-deoxy-manno-octulosonate cytidylyltransferase [Blochmannia endosymbiont of Camponotus sp.]URJ32521.1 3-deoxy-manno-octulosonate cytidylyltransferase [Blochmannia endosymbiont of Camponotus sp.]
MNFVVIIPIRFFSTRFPGKALADINGKPMIVRVMENALDSGANTVIIATDSSCIARVIESEQSAGEVCLTRSTHQSGTERLAEVAINYKFSDDQIIVHLQGDEPLLSSIMIRQVASILYSMNSTISMATLATPLSSFKEARDENVVKVVINMNSNALYFSRSMIPWNTGNFENHLDSRFPKTLLRHIGIYAYRAKFLHRYVKWTKSPLEQLEHLEQLRVLWHGETIHVSVIDDVFNISVDTPESLSRVNAVFKKNKYTTYT